MADRVPPETNTITVQWRARASLNVEAYQVHITIPILMIFNIAHDFTSRHSLISFTIPTLLAFLQLQTLGSQPSPFHVRPITASASVIGVLGYYLSSIAKRFLPSYASQLILAKSLLGSFSVASLASLLLPSSLWNLRFAFYVLLMVAEYHTLLRKLYDQYARRWQRQPPRMRVAMPYLLPQTSIDLMGLHEQCQ